MPEYTDISYPDIQPLGEITLVATDCLYDAVKHLDKPCMTDR